MQPHALVYFEDPYFVCRVRAGGPDEQWCSVLTLENTFGFGSYKWRAKATNPGPFKQHWLGGFERHHGFPTEGLIGFWVVNGICKAITHWEDASEDTTLSGQDWTEERTFKVSWTPSKVEYFVNDGVVAGHSANVPQGPMSFFFEAGRIGGTTQVDHAVLFRKESFALLE